LPFSFFLEDFLNREFVTELIFRNSFSQNDKNSPQKITATDFEYTLHWGSNSAAIV
jgi:hypothetical protein